MPIDVRPCASLDELRQGLVIWHYFGSEAQEEDATRFAKILDPERMHVAWDGPRAVGGAGAFTFELSLPGGRRVRAGGVTVVGVLPSHRRQGVLTALMRAQLDDVARRGEPVAWLWASEATIYGRFGYGLASYAADVEVDRARTRFAVDRPIRGQARLIDPAEALAVLPALYDRVLAETPGMFTRSAAWWEHRRLADLPARRNGGGVLQRVIVERDGEVVAYALYRVAQHLEHSISTGSLMVLEALGIDADATRAIWRYLLDVDWFAKVRAWQLPVDHPLLRLVAEPRHLGWRAGDALWVRLVDVGAALSARGYASGEPVVFEVTDRFRPENAGRWALADGVARRTDAPAGLALDVDALGSVYLGGSTFRQLALAGRVEERIPGALATADRVFATDRAPWCVEIF
jgi:predicted acetyltransferase